MDIVERSEVDPRYAWDLTSMFASDEAFCAALDEARGYPARLEAHRDDACASARGLLEFLQLNDTVDLALSRLLNYAQRKSDEDTRVARYQDFSAQAMTVYVQVGAATSWFAPALLALEPATVEGYLAQEPALETYRRPLERILARRDHALPAEQEELLARAGEMAATPENAYSMLADADLAFAPALDAAGAGHAVTNGGYIALQQSPDRTLRENAFESFMGGWRQFGNTCAATLQGQVKQLAFFARARRYSSSLEAALAANEVPTSVYANLVEAVEGRLAPLHRYVDLRKRLLGVDELHYWDLYVPVVGDVEMTFTYEEACDIVLQALAPLGEDYLAIVRRGLAGRWVDVYENPGKRSGAYSAGGYGMEPVVLMNFHGTLDDVFTLAHELGHSVHTYLSCRNQPPCCSDYPIFVAEVASTCNEALLIRWFLDNRANDPATRAYLINHFLEQFRGTMYRQTLFAAFEREAGAMNDRGEGLTCEALSALYADLCARYYGPGIAADPEIAIEWARIPHFYYNYYVYQYATGFAAAVALSQRILEQGAPAVADYLGFLSGGSSKPPLDLLRGAGVDLQTPAPVEAALDLFASLVDELEGLLG